MKLKEYFVSFVRLRNSCDFTINNQRKNKTSILVPFTGKYKEINCQQGLVTGDLVPTSKQTMVTYLIALQHCNGT